MFVIASYQGMFIKVSLEPYFSIESTNFLSEATKFDCLYSLQMFCRLLNSEGLLVCEIATEPTSDYRIVAELSLKEIYR